MSLIISTTKRVLIATTKCALLAFLLWMVGVAVECLVLDYNSTEANALVTASVIDALADRPQHVYKDTWYNDHIYCDGDVSSQLVSTIENVETYLPKSTLDAFIADGWHITATSAQDLTLLAESIGVDIADREIIGLTDVTTKTIWLDANTSSIIGSLLHEFGHYVDYNLGWPSKSDAFVTLYDSEHTAYSSYSSYAASDATEMFANLYSDLLLNSKPGLYVAPECAAYVADIAGLSGNAAS